MSASFGFDAPEHFTTGAVGPPGQRVFYLQARAAADAVTLRVEKEQVGALADYLEGLLAKLRTAGEEPSEGPALEDPLDPVWAIGAIGIGYDEGRDRIVVQATELLEEDAAAEAASARFAITRAQAAAFVATARALMKAGRPVCPFCSMPMDPGGHVCPRGNGHVAR